MANNFGLGFTFTGVDKFSGTVSRIEGAHKRVQRAAKETEKTVEKAGKAARDSKGRFLPKGGLGGAPSPSVGGGFGGGRRGGKGGFGGIDLGGYGGAYGGSKGYGGDASGFSKGALSAKKLADYTRAAAKEARGLKAAIEQVARRGFVFEVLANTVGGLGTTLAEKGLGAVKDSLVGAASASIDFESAMADVNKVLPEGTALQPIADGAKQLAKDIGILPNQVANLTASLAQSGIAGEELTLVAGDASRLAVAFGMSGQEAGQALAKLRTGLGLTRPEVNSLTGTINELSNKLAATAPEITDAVQRVGSVAKAANISAEAAAGLATAMIASGATAEVAATGTKTFLRSLGAGAAATKRQKLAFKSLGLDAVDTARKLTSGGLAAEATIKDVVSRIGNLAQEDKLPTLIRLFGSESIGAIGPLATNVKLLGQSFDIATNRAAAQGSVLKEYETRSKTTGASIDRLKANFAVLAIEIGDRLMPIVRYGIDAFSSLIERARVWGGDLLALGRRISAFGASFTIFSELKLLYDSLVQVFSQGGFSGAVRKELDRAENSGIKKFVIRIYMLFGRLRVFFEGVASGFMKAWEVVGPKLAALFDHLRTVALALFNVFATEGNDVATSSMNSWRVWGDTLASGIGTVLGWTVSLVGGFAALLARNEWLVKSIVYGVIAFKAFRLGVALVQVSLAAGALAVKAYTVAVKFSAIAMQAAAIGMKIFRFAVAGVTFVMKALRLAVLTNPILALVTGLVLGAGLIYKYWEPISTFFTNLWESVTAAFKVALDWILEKIEWVGNKIEDFKFAVSFTGKVEEGKALQALQDTQKGSRLFDNSEEENARHARAYAPTTDTLSRARAEAANAPRVTLADSVRQSTATAAANAANMGQTMAKRFAEEREMAMAQATTGGGNMSINLLVDGEKMATVVANKGKASKARTFSQVDPRDDEE